MRVEGAIKRQCGGKIIRSAKLRVSQVQLKPDSRSAEKRDCCALRNIIRRFVICPNPGLNVHGTGLSGILSQMN